jgi:hypothetical protein
MGLFSFFKKLVDVEPPFACPLCGDTYARTVEAKVYCQTFDCQNFDDALRNFKPKGEVKGIVYENYIGEVKTFEIDCASIKLSRDRLSASASPTGRRLSLHRDKIQNLEDFRSYIDRAIKVAHLDSADRQVLTYHSNKGSTSERYEAILKELED